MLEVTRQLDLTDPEKKSRAFVFNDLHILKQSEDIIRKLGKNNVGIARR